MFRDVRACTPCCSGPWREYFIGRLESAEAARDSDTFFRGTVVWGSAACLCCSTARAFTLARSVLPDGVCTSPWPDAPFGSLCAAVGRSIVSSKSSERFSPFCQNRKTHTKPACPFSPTARTPIYSQWSRHTVDTRTPDSTSELRISANQTLKVGLWLACFHSGPAA
jgi:hypothetical protein